MPAKKGKLDDKSAVPLDKLSLEALLRLKGLVETRTGEAALNAAVENGTDIDVEPEEIELDGLLGALAMSRIRQQRAMYKAAESRLRDAFWLLDIEGPAPPGLERIEQRVLSPRRYYTLYRFTPAVADTAAIVPALLDRVAEVARAYAGDANIQMLAGATFVRAGRPALHYDGVANIGYRPTLVAERPELPEVEVHLLDFRGDLYGELVELEFVRRLRDERRFAGLDELRAQIARDVAQARAILGGEA